METTLEPSGSCSRKRSHSKIEQTQNLRGQSRHTSRGYSAKRFTTISLPSTSCQHFHTGRSNSEAMERRSVDLRRPMFSEDVPEVIDLTSEVEIETDDVSEHHPEASNFSMSSSFPVRQSEVIDLDSQDSEDSEDMTDSEGLNEAVEDSGSSDVEFISSRRLPDPPPDQAPNHVTHERVLPTPTTMLDSGYDHFPAIPSGFRPSPGPYHRRIFGSPWLVNPTTTSSVGAESHASRFNLSSSVELLRPPSIFRGMASVARGHASRLATNFFPTNLDYAVPAFSMAGFMATRGPPRPAPPPPAPTYSPPPPAREGFTRSPKEDDVLICPNCLDELCVGEGTEKSKVYVVRACGHVYCGECAKYRHKTKHNGKQPANTKSQPFSICKVPDCGKAVKAPGAMVELYL